MKNTLMQLPTYAPNNLIDAVIDRLNLKNDSHLSRVLGVQPYVISRIRHHKVPVGASVLVRMNQETGICIKALRTLMGDRRKYFHSKET